MTDREAELKMSIKSTAYPAGREAGFCGRSEKNNFGYDVETVLNQL